MTPESRHVAGDGLRIHVLDRGGAGAPLVLLHGGSAHARWWDAVATRLADAFRVVAMDLRGHGDSDPAPAGRYRIADHARDLAAVIAALGLERPAVAGHSLGSFVALHHAVEHPRSLAALVLVDGRASFASGGSRAMRILASFPPAEHDDLEEAVRRFRPLPKETIAERHVLEQVARASMRRTPEGRWTPKFDRAALLADLTFDLRDRLGEIECPVLFLRGERTKMLSAAAAARLAALCRDGRVVEVPGAHHHLPIDRPDFVAAEMRSFLLASAAAARAGRRARLDGE